MLTQARVKELLDYDPATGVILWRGFNKYRKQQIPNSVAGYVGAKGYLSIGIDGKYYRLHRIMWLYMTGNMPTDQIDHINGDRTDNRFANLRSATNSQNKCNMRVPPRTNKLGMLGVSLHKGKFRATIKIGDKCKHLGYFNTPEIAHAAYLEAKRKHHAFCTI